MSKKRISRNAPCPCGSGKKYKNCCYGKGFEWVEDEDGTVGKSIPMTEEVNRDHCSKFGKPSSTSMGGSLSQMSCSSRILPTWNIWKPCWLKT